MARRCRMLAAVLLLVPGALASQTVHGVVVEDSSRQPVAGATVELLMPGLRGRMAAQTNAEGEFMLLPRRGGPFQLRVRHLAFTRLVTDSMTLGASEVVRLELRVARTAIVLEPVVVTARSQARDRLSGFEERRASGAFGHFITRAEIAERRGANAASELLRGRAGVEIARVAQCNTPTGDGGLGDCGGARTSAGNESMPPVALIVMRNAASGYCHPAIYLDGMPMRQFNDTGVDDFLRPEMIAGVEIYPRSAGAPAEFFDPKGCGVVAFWTREGALGSDAPVWKRLLAGSIGFVLVVALTR
jgi:hypothetical protein